MKRKTVVKLDQMELDCMLIDDTALQSKITNLNTHMHDWAQAALINGITDVDYWVNFQFMSGEEIQSLNKQFRNKDKPTNVLTFPNNTPFDPEDPFLGDIAICTEILEQEATKENKSLQNHLAHLVIHSILHTQGLDHQTDEEAKRMELIEIELLNHFDIPNPYKD
jgi:probable rRNA maturation factor